MNVFSKYEKVIVTEQNIDNVSKALSEAEISLSNYKYIKSFYDGDTENVVFSPKSEGWVCYNSFVPAVEMKVAGTDKGTELQMNFELIKGVKVIIGLMFVFCAIMEIALIISCVKGMIIIRGITDVLVMCIPLLIIIFIQVLARVCMRIVSGGFIKKIREIVK